VNAYAGIGSRETPSEFLHLAAKTAEHLSERGWLLRSGHAPGADQAFEGGCHGISEIYLPWPKFEADVPFHALMVQDRPLPDAYEIAAHYHPAWNRLKHGAKALHARNVHQVLGKDLDDPVKFVLYWTKGGKEVGGTAQAMRIAHGHEVPVYCLGTPEHWPKIAELL